MEAIDKRIAEFISINSGSGDGSGSGSGYGSGNGSGDGSGYGNGSGVKKYNGEPVHLIDGVATVIKRIHGNVARGYIVNADLTTTKTYVVKQDNTFAHGSTLKEAMDALCDKLFEDMPEEERIAEFIEKYPALDTVCKNADLFDWHHRLTGSCLQGRTQFQRDNGLSLEDSITVAAFIKLTENAYGGIVIRKLRERYGAK